MNRISGGSSNPGKEMPASRSPPPYRVLSMGLQQSLTAGPCHTEPLIGILEIRELFRMRWWRAAHGKVDEFWARIRKMKAVASWYSNLFKSEMFSVLLKVILKHGVAARTCTHTHTQHSWCILLVFYCWYWVGEKEVELQTWLYGQAKPTHDVLSSLWRFSMGIRTGENLFLYQRLPC